MLIEKLNQYTEEQIVNLKNDDNQLRLLIKECPNVDKLKLLTDAVVNETTEVTPIGKVKSGRSMESDVY